MGINKRGIDMKRKIKELTIEETIIVCKRQNICYNCPLIHVCAEIPVYLHTNHKEDLEKEIEI